MHNEASPQGDRSGERLQKALARAGFGSRREIEGWIREGRVVVNGSPAKLGDKVIPGSRILIDGERARIPDLTLRRRVLAYHKPEGEICTRSDPQGRRTIFESLPGDPGGKWVTVGRLDLNTSGLLLVTNDGELAHKLMHPSSGVIREYAVRILGSVDAALIKRLKSGVRLDDGMAAFDDVIEAGGKGANRWYKVKIREGRRRGVRRIWESQGLKVSRLIRTKYGPVSLPRSLKAGEWQELRGKDLETLVGAVPAAKPPAAVERMPEPRRPRRGQGKRTRGR